MIDLGNRVLAGALVAGALSLATAALGEAGKTSDFAVGEGAKLLVPLPNAPKTGSTVTLKEHQSALLAALAFEAGVMMPEDRSFTAGGIDWTITRDTRLLKMTGWSGGDTVSFPANSSVWCELQSREPRKAKPKPAEEVKAVLKRNFEDRVMLCLVDEGGDGSFDRAFVKGAKPAELRRSIAITPISYTPLRKITLPRSVVAVVFHHQNMFHTPRFYVQGFMSGQQFEVFSLGFAEDQQDPSRIQTIAGSINTPPGELPRTLRYGTGKFTILAIDGKTKQATVRIDSAWSQEPVRITRTVYAY